MGDLVRHVDEEGFVFWLLFDDAFQFIVVLGGDLWKFEVCLDEFAVAVDAFVFYAVFGGVVVGEAEVLVEALVHGVGSFHFEADVPFA